MTLGKITVSTKLISCLSEPQYRLGNPANLPEIDEKYKIYDPPVSVWIKIYAFVAAAHSNLLYEFCLKLKTSFSQGLDFLKFIAFTNNFRAFIIVFMKNSFSWRTLSSQELLLGTL